jgi:hypothetical protein
MCPAPEATTLAGVSTRTAVRTLAALAATASFALSVAACGGSGGGRVAGLGSSTTRDRPATTAALASGPAGGAVAFARCMRADGVPDFPDPGSDGQFPKATLGQLAASDSHYQAAQAKCVHFLPGGASGPSPSQVERVKHEALEFSRCIRSHGVPNFPDPGSDGRIPDPASDGINQGSPQFEAANQACGAYRPPYMPSNSEYNAWARTHGS